MVILLYVLEEVVLQVNIVFGEEEIRVKVSFYNKSKKVRDFS